MTKIVIIQGHPDASQTHLCHAIADSYATAARQNGHEVSLITIATEDFPILRSKADWESGDLPQVAVDGQAAISAADHIVLIYPLWMGDMPALLKAWIEQVLREGFAFKITGKSWETGLKGKSARIFVTMGMPGAIYRWFFFAHSLRSLDRNILKLCGIRPVRWSIFGNVEDSSGKTQKRILAKAANLGRAAQ